MGYREELGELVRCLAVNQQEDAMLNGAEVGAAWGRTSKYLLGRFPQLSMHLVDTWRRHEPDSRYVKSGDAMPAMVDLYLDAMLLEIEQLQEQYTSRARVHHTTSLEAAGSLDDDSLDFAFIDADHSYAAVTEDCRAWWPKVRAGGMLVGHDYVRLENLLPSHPAWTEGLIFAWDEFSVAVGNPIHVAADAICWIHKL